MLIVLSRTALLDSLLPPLLVGAALCILVERRGWLLAGGALLGAAVAVKWQAIPVVLGTAVAFAAAGRRRVAAVAFVAVPLAVYVASYAGHPPGEWLERQGDMVTYHRQFRIDHVYDSSPVGWLLLERPVPFGLDTAPEADRVARTLALGNPALWWSFVASLPVLLVAWWRGRDRTVEVVLLAWATLHVSWLVVLRPGFSYYLGSLVPFMAIGVAWTLRRLGRRWLTVAVSAAVGIAFVAFLPLWTHQEIGVDRFDDLLLFDSWEP
jgi:dolichyl-phosphate-mannose--protein O-mannosyl transferase